MGWEGKKGTATGFFHVEQIDDRWWMIDPGGRVFLSVGINHVQPRMFFWDYNRSYWEKKYGRVEDPLNLDSFMRSKACDIWINTVREDFLEWGFNTMGALSSIELKPPEMPYTVMVPWFYNNHSAPAGTIEFPDVFGSKFEKQCDEVARQNCQPRADDPLLEGYCYLEGLILSKDAAGQNGGDLYWGFIRGEIPTWPEALKSMRCFSDRNYPGKERYVELLMERYGSIEAFNKVYGMNLESFRGVLFQNMTAINPKDEVRAAEDDEAFLRIILDRYYKVTHDALRRYDPNHLIFGDRYNGHGQNFIPEAAIEAMKPYVDVFSVHRYGFFDEIKSDLERWHQLSGKPVFLVDPAIAVVDENMPRPFGPQVDSQETRSEEYKKFIRSMFSLPYVVAVHWCGYVDIWASALEEKQMTGIKDAFERPYPIAKSMKEFNTQIYEFAARQVRT